MPVDPLQLIKPTPRLKCRRWTRDEIATIRDLMSAGRTDAYIGMLFGVSALAIQRVRWQRGMRRRGNHDDLGWFTVYDLQRLFGHGSRDPVLAWVRMGWLDWRWSHGRKGYRFRVISRTNLLRFLDDACHWHEWQPGDLTDELLREYAEVARTGVAYLNVSEAADRIGVAPVTLRQWIARGELPIPTRQDRRGRHWLLASDVDRMAKSYQWGYGIREAA